MRRHIVVALAFIASFYSPLVATLYIYMYVLSVMYSAGLDSKKL